MSCGFKSAIRFINLNQQTYLHTGTDADCRRALGMKLNRMYYSNNVNMLHKINFENLVYWAANVNVS